MGTATTEPQIISKNNRVFCSLDFLYTNASRRGHGGNLFFFSCSIYGSSSTHNFGRFVSESFSNTTTSGNTEKDKISGSSTQLHVCIQIYYAVYILLSQYNNNNNNNSNEIIVRFYFIAVVLNFYAKYMQMSQ